MTRDEAQSILDRCAPDTPREEVVWAALVQVCDRASYFAELPILQTVPKPWASFGGGHHYIECDGHGLSVRSEGSKSALAVPPVTYAEIADLATLDRIGVDLHERIRAAVRLVDEREARQECRRLTVQVWQRCRPGAAPEQLDLLDLIGVGDGA